MNQTSNGVKSISRAAVIITASLTLLVPTLAAAQSSIYTDSNGNFSFQSKNFSISFGNGGMFACGASNICQVASTIIYIINNVLVPVIFAVAFIVFLYGIVLKYIFSHGDPGKVAEGHKILLWGLIAFVIMISLWGLVNVVSNTFGLAGQYAPPPPRSY